MAEGTFVGVKSITDVIDDAKKKVIEVNGRLMTEEEAVQLTDIVKGRIYKDN